LVRKILDCANCTFLSGLLTFLSAASSIGFVKSTGDFRVDGAAIRGNGTVFEGNLIETGPARCVLQLANAQITLAPESRARVYHDRTVLERGAGIVQAGGGHRIDAATLRIAPSARYSVVQIEITSPTYVTAGTHGGGAEVRNIAGVLVASLQAGKALAFNPRAAAAAAVKMTGLIDSHNGAYFLTDETTKVTVQLKESSDAARYAGQKVEITGSSIPGSRPAGAASQLVRAVTVKPAGGRDKGAAAAGLSGARATIVGGVAAAGVVTGPLAAGIFRSAGALGPP
jgi:hypothetical protein